MDVKTAFLNGLLDEDIYMVQPEGYYWKVRILNTVKLDEAEGRQHSGRDRSGCWKPLEGKNEDSKVID
ncbi:unnamed protein product [Phytophthora lilii]|uniref:Unnamed protein product n=1 Tax=Phytophthora lilii TaxID=2077276 RepID=A0A9W7D0Y0_9STRA|nr:unnamed protein product [Phytophthora lilii]